MLDSRFHNPPNEISYRISIITLDSHNAMPCERALSNLVQDFKGLELSIFAAAEWGENPSALEEAKAAIGKSDIIIVNLLFLEDHIQPILPLLTARREECDAMIGVVCDADLVRLTRMGSLDMQAPESGAVALLKKLRGSSKPSSETGEKKMRIFLSSKPLITLS